MVAQHFFNIVINKFTSNSIFMLIFLKLTLNMINKLTYNHYILVFLRFKIIEIILILALHRKYIKTLMLQMSKCYDTIILPPVFISLNL